MNIQQNIVLSSVTKLAVFVLTAVLLILASSSVASASVTYLTCPFSPMANRTIVNFNADLVWKYKDKPQEAYRDVALPAGNYTISAFSYDNYDTRNTVSQPNESYFLDLKYGSTLITTSNKTPDLADNVKNATWSGVINHNFHVPAIVSTVVARHANYLQEMPSPNSLTVGCVAFDLIIPPPDPTLNVSCAGSPAVVNIGQNVNWTRTLTGGNGSYTYSWSGTDGLTGSNQSTTGTYYSAGTKNATVTVTSGAQTKVASCSVVVNAVPDPTLNVSCAAIPTSVNIGHPVQWGALVTGGTGAYTYTWSDVNGVFGTSQLVAKSYSTAGIKNSTVTVTSGAQSRAANCSVIVNPPQASTLIGSCSVNPSSVNVGGALNWSATATGGTGAYTYFWEGTDGLYGSSAAVSRTYNSAGPKTGKVTISSGADSISYTCNASVVNPQSNLSVSCEVDDSSVTVDEDVRFTATASGGNGNYSYDWDGTDGLSGTNRTVRWSYDSRGTKRATVTVTSNGQTARDSCTVRVDEEEEDLEVTCYANPTNSQIGGRVNWYAEVAGGVGSYRYSWSGTDGLNSSSRNPSMVYNTAGTKSATVTVRDGDGNRDSYTCRTTVNQNAVLAFSQYNPTPLAGAVYLSQVPYTGVADDWGYALFVSALLLFSAYVAYVIISYQKSRSIADTN